MCPAPAPPSGWRRGRPLGSLRWPRPAWRRPRGEGVRRGARGRGVRQPAAAGLPGRTDGAPRACGSRGGGRGGGGGLRRGPDPDGRQAGASGCSGDHARGPQPDPRHLAGGANTAAGPGDSSARARRPNDRPRTVADIGRQSAGGQAVDATASGAMLARQTTGPLEPAAVRAGARRRAVDDRRYHRAARAEPDHSGRRCSDVDGRVGAQGRSGRSARPPQVRAVRPTVVRRPPRAPRPRRGQGRHRPRRRSPAGFERRAINVTRHAAALRPFSRGEFEAGAGHRAKVTSRPRTAISRRSVPSCWP